MESADDKEEDADIGDSSIAEKDGGNQLFKQTSFMRDAQCYIDK